MRKVDLPVGHEVVNSHELATLRRKARAHDAYLWETKRMADKVRASDDLLIGQAGDTTKDARMVAYAVGYRNSLKDFATLVKDAPME